MSELTDNLNEILRQKNEILVPENVKSGINYLGRTGTLNTVLPSLWTLAGKHFDNLDIGSISGIKRDTIFRMKPVPGLEIGQRYYVMVHCYSETEEYSYFIIYSGNMSLQITDGVVFCPRGYYTAYKMEGVSPITASLDLSELIALSNNWTELSEYTNYELGLNCQVDIATNMQVINIESSSNPVLLYPCGSLMSVSNEASYINIEGKEIRGVAQVVE